MGNERILITGGAGFIGRALVARCLEDGHAVTVVDNFCAGRIENLMPFLDRVQFHELDILDAPQLEQVIAQARPQIVFHMAAHHFIPFCNEHPRETLRVNVEGTYLVLKEAARQGARIAVVASSGVLYPSRDHLLSEDLPVAPEDVYGISKQLAEQIAGFVTTTTGLTVIAARLFNTYGPHETNPHLIPHILDSLRHGPNVELGNIHTKRDYIHVSDVAELLYRCALNPPQKFTVVNIGTGIEHSASEIIEALKRLLDKEIRISIDDSRVRAVDKLHQRADTQRLRTITGIDSCRSLSEGLRELLVHEGLIHCQ